MLQDNESEKEIRLVLSREEETTQQVSITPMKRPSQQHEDDEQPFMDEPFDAYKVWLNKQPTEKAKSNPSCAYHLMRTRSTLGFILFTNLVPYL